MLPQQSNKLIFCFSLRCMHVKSIVVGRASTRIFKFYHLFEVINPPHRCCVYVWMRRISELNCLTHMLMYSTSFFLFHRIGAAFWAEREGKLEGDAILFLDRVLLSQLLGASMRARRHISAAVSSRAATIWSLVVPHLRLTACRTLRWTVVRRVVHRTYGHCEWWGGDQLFDKIIYKEMRWENQLLRMTYFI